MMGEPSRLDRLQIRLNLMRRTVRELEEQIERERNPAARHAKPKLRVIKGGLSAFAGPFIVAGHLARENAIQTAAVAAFAVGVPAASIIAEAPPPAQAEQVTSSAQAPHDGAAPPGGDYDGSAISAVSPGPDSTPPSASPGPAFTPTPASTASALAALEIMPPAEPVVTPSELFPSLEPLPTPTVTVEPEPIPTPEPSPTGTEPALETPKNAGQAHVEAVDACLVQRETVKMQDCLAALVS